MRIKALKAHSCQTNIATSLDRLSIFTQQRLKEKRRIALDKHCVVAIVKPLKHSVKPVTV